MYCLPLGILFLFDTDVVDMAYSYYLAVEDVKHFVRNDLWNV